MHYFATLTLGDNYVAKGVRFTKNQEVPVTKEVFDYVSGVEIKDVLNESGQLKLVVAKVFKTRTEEFSKAEAVIAEVNSQEEIVLGPKKPGPKPK